MSGRLREDTILDCYEILRRKKMGGLVYYAAKYRGIHYALNVARYYKNCCYWPIIVKEMLYLKSHYMYKIKIVLMKMKKFKLVARSLAMCNAKRTKIHLHNVLYIKYIN